ncbi:MAG: diguanylate cyclase [Gemmatimonadetes bacterium]|nr:MAG: diguanylate cyclase [Gemmatimonadota bacterium]
MANISRVDHWWSRLFEIGTVLNYSVPDYDHTLVLIVDTVVELTQADRGILVLMDEAHNREIAVARTAHHENLTGLQQDPATTQLLNHVLQYVQETGEILWVKEPLTDPYLADQHAALEKLQLSAMLCIPLKVILREQDKQLMHERREIPLSYLHDIIGVVYVDRQHQQLDLSRDELMFFQALGNQATIAMINARLYQQATTDALTHVDNRRYFEQRLTQEIRIADQNKIPFSLVIIDVDRFQQVNRRYGHQQGDAVLAELAQTIRESVRKADICARYGGDMFILLCPQTDLKGGKVVAEQVREAVEKKAFHNCDVPLTISAGVVAYPEHAPNKEMLVKHMDQALARAKLDGGNCYRVWEADYEAQHYRFDKLAGIFTGETARDYRNVVMLLDVIEALTATVKLEELMVSVVDMIIDLTGAERGLLFTIDEYDTLILSVARNQHQESLPLSISYSRSVVENVLKTGISTCHTESGKNPVNSQSGMLLQLKTIMCVPLKVKDRKVGVIYVDSQALTREFSYSELAFLECLSDQIAIAIENVRLYDQLDRTNRELTHVVEELKMLDRMKSNFITNISHELRTPLSGIIACSELLASGVDLGLEKTRKFATSILNQSRNLSTIANDIIHIAEEDAGKVEWAMEDLRLQDVIRNVYDNLAPNFEKKGITFQLDVEEDAPPVHGNAIKLELALSKLVDNAYKFTPAKGSVLISLQHDKNWLILSVIDTGKGIPSEDQKHIFTRFYQAGDILTNKPEGTGLGLAICEDIIKKHGGRIWVESPYHYNEEISSGCKFIIKLPSAKRHAVMKSMGG